MRNRGFNADELLRNWDRAGKFTSKATVSKRVGTRTDTGDQMLTWEPIHTDVPCILGTLTPMTRKGVPTTEVTGQTQVGLMGYFEDIDETCSIRVDGIIYDIDGVQTLPLKFWTVLSITKQTGAAIPGA